MSHVAVPCSPVGSFQANLFGRHLPHRVQRPRRFRLNPRLMLQTTPASSIVNCTGHQTRRPVHCEGNLSNWNEPETKRYRYRLLSPTHRQAGHSKVTTPYRLFLLRYWKHKEGQTQPYRWGTCRVVRRKRRVERCMGSHMATWVACLEFDNIHD